MSGAHSWSVKGVDPKAREAAREAAAREGVSLGEYVSRTLQQQAGQPTQGTPPARLRPVRAARPSYEDDEADWQVTGPADMQRGADPARLSQRIDAIERRTQLAITGLDRTVSTIDRSMLGLAARIDDVESISHESADRIADALDQFRVASETMAGQLEASERESADSREALADARAELAEARDRLEAQVSTAEDVARKAEAAVAFLTAEIENREAALGHRVDSFEDETRDAVAACLAEARASAADAALAAAQSAREAIAELHAVQERLNAHMSETKAAMGHLVDHAVEEARSARSSLVSEIVRIDSEFQARDAAAEDIRQAQAALIARIEKVEQGSREATAGLRQAAGAAISDLRNAQLGLAARLKQVEEAPGGQVTAVELAEIRARQADIVERLADIERRAPQSPVVEALAAFERRLDDIAGRVGEDEGARAKLNHIDGAVRTLDAGLQVLSDRVGESETSRAKLDEVGGEVRKLDANLQRLAERLAETESTANTAIRTLEETVASVAARATGAGAGAESDTEALRSMLEQRLDEMALSVAQMVDAARAEVAEHVNAALGAGEGEGFDGAFADINRRLAAAERRQAQTIEAISIEIKRMSETVDRRLRAVEARGDGEFAATTVREEIAQLSKSLEARFEEIERREAAAFDRMGLEIGRVSERVEERTSAVEMRSAQAIEQVGEQVARVAERLTQRQDAMQRDLTERVADSEVRTGARIDEAVASMRRRLAEAEERSVEVVAPVQKAVSSVATRLDALASDKEDDGATPQERLFEDFGSISPAPPAPMDAAQPLRAAPLPPTQHAPAPLADGDDDLYYEDSDLIADDAPPALVEAHLEETDAAEVDAPAPDDAFFADEDAFAPPPPEDDDPFWSPTDVVTGAAEAPLEPLAPEAEPALGAAPRQQGRNDYLNAARRAAQAQSAPPKRANADLSAPPPYSLRGSSRVVLWGAASAIALLIAGASWYLGSRGNEERAAAEPASPPAPDATAQYAAPTEVLESNVEFPAPQVQESAEASAEGGLAVTPAEPESAARAPQRAVTPRERAPVAAAPLAPRSVSLEQAAQRGDAVAQYELALQRISGGRTADGVQLLRRAADAGLAMAQYRLAKLYERGEGMPTDLSQARQWTERAAASGNRRAMHDLGVYFARGEGAAIDEAAAFRWFRQAAELGVADSQYNLGVLYQQGRGVGANPAEAMFWFQVAARQGDEDASSRAHALEAQLSPLQIEQARARAQAFRPRAASATANGEFGPRPWTAQVRG